MFLKIEASAHVVVFMNAILVSNGFIRPGLLPRKNHQPTLIRYFDTETYELPDNA